MPTTDIHDPPRVPRHTCCGARISIGAYGDWHLCEACEVELARRHCRRRTAALPLSEESDQEPGRHAPALTVGARLPLAGWHPEP